MRQKIIIALVLACCALLLAWGVSRVAFRDMLSTVENITAPNERLRIVHELSSKISALDQLQKRQALNAPGNYARFFKQSKQLRMNLDTLRYLYQDDTVQLNRIASISELLKERDKQFVNYLKVRERLVNNKNFSNQVQKFNELVSKNTADSTVVTSEQKTLTTTVIPEEKDNRGFLSKLFTRKKPEDSKSFRIVNEENVKRDTIATANDANMVRNLEESLRAIEKEQKLKSASFLNREAVLANANSRLISQMLDILRKVEGEAVAQIELNSLLAKKVVNTGISRITVIMVVFFVLTIVLLYLILTDITRTNRYRKDLETARDEAEFHGRAKQRFLSNMSHEIRTPLQSIIGYAEIIRQQLQPQRKDIDAIYHSSEHLLQIVNEVLDYNRIISGKFTFSNQKFDMSALLEEVVLIVSPQADKKGLLLTSDVDLQGVKTVYGDPFRLKQILLNLLGNAIKFTAHGEVVLSAFYKRQSDDLHFTFMVKDTGIGFSEEEGKYIFGEFEQSESPAKKGMEQEGSGLGLAIVKALVEGQDGRIYAKSDPGLGSSFTVYLTFKLQEGEVAEELADVAVPVLGSEIWVVDDDQLILDLCSLIFERHDIRYKCFNAPADMLAADLNNQVRYLLMDMRMPEMSGKQLYRLMKPKLSPEIKVYAVTAQALPEERQDLLDQGFDGVMIKPFREQELLALFDESCAQRFDPAYLEKMTFGDVEQLHKVLDRFVTDSLADIAALKESGGAAQGLLVHRLAGRIAQIGS
ncbi:MAG: response regulator, partial [Pedobacter sp.]